MLINKGNGREDRTGALLDAVREGDCEKAAMLLDKGSDVDERGKDGLTPLMLAARQENVAMAYLLLSRGADVSLSSGYDLTAMDHALLAASSDRMIRLLESYGAVIDQMNLDASFIDACAWEPLDMGRVRLLLSLGADINTDAFGERAIDAALRRPEGNDKEDLVSFLVSKGAVMP